MEKESKTTSAAEELAAKIAGIEYKYCKAEYLGNLGIWRRDDASEAQNILAQRALDKAFSDGVNSCVKVENAGN